MTYAVKYTTMSRIGASEAIPNYYCNPSLIIGRFITSIPFNSCIRVTRSGNNKSSMRTDNIRRSIARNIIVCNITALHVYTRGAATNIIESCIVVILYGWSAVLVAIKYIVA